MFFPRLSDRNLKRSVLFCPESISLGRDDTARAAVCRGGTKLVRAADDEDGEGGARGLRPRWPRKARLGVGEKAV